MSDNVLLGRISRYLMLYCSHQENLGLLSGKMGCAIFFFHYFKYTNSIIYSDFAKEIVDEIYDEIHLDYSKCFKDGFAGIAWGLEYITHHKFISGCTGDSLSDLDNMIVEQDWKHINNESLETGFKGIAYYVISRFSNGYQNKSIISEQYIYTLITLLEKEVPKDIESLELISGLKLIIARQKIPFNTMFLDNIISKTNFNRINVLQDSRAIGIINNGYAGIGLKLMKKAEKENIFI